MKFVTVPRFPTVAASTNLLKEIYGGYLSRNYTLVHEDALWEIWMSNRVDRARSTGGSEAAEIPSKSPAGTER